MSLHRDGQALFAEITHPQTCVPIAVAVSEKMKSATIKHRDVWDFAQLTFNLDVINWRWRIREEECKVD